MKLFIKKNKSILTTTYFRYANKIIHNVGLVICVQDINDISSVGHIDSEIGGVNYKIK